MLRRILKVGQISSLLVFVFLVYGCDVEDLEDTDIGTSIAALDGSQMAWGFASYNAKQVYVWNGSLTLEQRVDRLIDDLNSANAKWYRPNFIWSDIEPQLKRASMTRSEITSSMIQRYAFPEYYSNWGSYAHFFEPDWSFYDLLVDEFDANGINIMPVLCNGDSKQMPYYNGARIYPDSPYVNRESYMAHAKLHAAGAALRYSSQVKYYQAENELNAAGLQVMPWLSREGLSAWNDWGFQTDLLTTIADAIRSSDGDATIATNIVVIGVDWHSHINDWTSGANANLLDIVGVDVYANYLYGWPIDTHSVGGCVEEAYMYSNGKPVMVSETGYPTSPWWLGFNQSNQATYVEQNMEDAWANGAIGFFYYRLVTSESWSGGFPQEGYWGFVKSNYSYKSAMTRFYNETVQHPYLNSLPESCRGDCGGYGGSCWCDDLCQGYGDCCDDYEQFCL